MTHAEFLAWLWRVAGGWLGWRPQEFEYANMSDIMEAYHGHLEKLKLIHGGGEKEKPSAANPLEKVDAEEFDRVFG